MAGTDSSEDKRPIQFLPVNPMESYRGGEEGDAGASLPPPSELPTNLGLSKPEPKGTSTPAIPEYVSRDPNDPLFAETEARANEDTPVPGSERELIPAPGGVTRAAGGLDPRTSAGIVFASSGIFRYGKGGDGLPHVYRPIKLIGQGGFGEVWEAEQRTLRRVVAIKRLRADVIRYRVPENEAVQFLERFFRQEAYTAAHLDHPNILPVHDLGLDDEGNPVIAMKLVRGRAWSDLMAEDFPVLSVEDFLARHIPIMISLCNAVAFAHARAIIHRDIKPGQVMVGEYGEVLLMDWGLAVSLDPATLKDQWKPAFTPMKPNVKLCSNPAGTPAFMAPEQTEQSAENLGPWTDVYLLGGTLFLVLTGQPPYAGMTTQQVFQDAARGARRSFEAAAPGRAIPEQLAELVTEAMKPNWRERSLTAKDFVRCLEEYRSGAAPRRESRRIVEDVAACLGSEASTYVTFNDMLLQINHAFSLWPGNPELPAVASQLRHEYVQHALRHGDLELARLQALELPDSPEKGRLQESIEEALNRRRRRESQRRVAMYGLAGLFLFSLVMLLVVLDALQDADRQRSAALKAEETARHNAEKAIAERSNAEREQYYAAIGYAASALSHFDVRKTLDVLQETPASQRAWEWSVLYSATRREEFRYDDLTPEDRGLITAAWSANGEWLALGGEGRFLALARPGREETFPLEGHADKIYQAAFSPNSRLLASTSKDRTARVWEVATRRPLVVLEGHDGAVNTVGWSPDSLRLVTASNDTTARVWEASGNMVMAIRGAADYLTSASYSPDGKRILTAGRDRHLRLYDAVSGDLLREGKTAFARGLTCATFSPDGRLILAGSWDADARLYNAETLEETRLFRTHQDTVYRTLFSPTLPEAYTVSHDGTVVGWDIESGRQTLRLVGHPAAVWDAALDPTGSKLITAGYEGDARLWDLGQLRAKPMPIPGPVSFAPGTERVPLLAVMDTSYQRADDVWETKMGGGLWKAGRWRVAVTQGNHVFSSDARHQVPLRSGAGRVLSPSGDLVEELTGATSISAAFSADGRLLLQGTATDVNLWRVEDWRRIHARTLPRPARAVAFAPGATAYVVVEASMESKDARVSLVSTATGENLWQVEGAFWDVDAIAVSPDGKQFAIATLENWTIRVFSFADGAEVSSARGHSDRILTLAFHPKGHRLVSTSWDGSVRLWEPNSGREVMVFPRVAGELPLGASFTADGSALITASSFGRLHVWDTLAPAK